MRMALSKQLEDIKLEKGEYLMAGSTCGQLRVYSQDGDDLIVFPQSFDDLVEKMGFKGALLYQIGGNGHLPLVPNFRGFTFKCCNNCKHLTEYSGGDDLEICGKYRFDEITDEGTNPYEYTPPCCDGPHDTDRYTQGCDGWDPHPDLSESTLKYIRELPQHEEEEEKAKEHE